jgi:hypothetical protein
LANNCVGAGFPRPLAGDLDLDREKETVTFAEK